MPQISGTTAGPAHTSKSRRSIASARALKSQQNNDYNCVLGPSSGGVTPVPIPNTEVKPTSAEDTRDVGPWENRSGPGSKTTSSAQAQEVVFLFRRFCDGALHEDRGSHALAYRAALDLPGGARAQQRVLLRRRAGGRVRRARLP